MYEQLIEFINIIYKIRDELLLFAGAFFIIGALDDIAIDVYWLWLRLTGRNKTARVDRQLLNQRALKGDAVIFIPAWQESHVIGHTIAHMLNAWLQPTLRLYIGCYRNDMATLSAAMNAAKGDPRLRLVVHDCHGPSTKGDCLNRLYQALQSDEERYGRKARMVVFHDAEDMVDPAALVLLDEAMDDAQFVQLPVLALPQPKSRWLGSHYCEEFAEAHAKTLVVRDALGAGLPSAGVGCAVNRELLEGLAAHRPSGMPFADDSLTEDYEMGLELARLGSVSRFLRARTTNGELIATRAYFPSHLSDVVRQKTRWVHGIALQGWDRLGWSISGTKKEQLAEIWMRMRDRRSPLSALVLLAGYVLIVLSVFILSMNALGLGQELVMTPLLYTLLIVNIVAFAWRAVLRFIFTAREFGTWEGARALMRIPITNIVAIMAGRRALTAYAKTLAGGKVAWEKTPHRAHPLRSFVEIFAK